jgi:uracil-DNA glycosylase
MDWCTAVPADSGWAELLARFGQSEAGERLTAYLQTRLHEEAVVFPPQPFKALALTPLSEVKVVIVGQDPYHEAGQAEGLAFSVAVGVRIPPSLRNIFKELMREGLIGAVPGHGSLAAWAQRGVLLLNTALTVEEGQAASHSGQGWEVLTDDILQLVASTRAQCVYLLWGVHAQRKTELIRQAVQQLPHPGSADVLILQANHPSPLSALRQPAPFIGCGHFSAVQHWWAARGVSWCWPTDDVGFQASNQPNFRTGNNI